MALCGVSVRFVHAGASSVAIMTAATAILFFIFVFLESDTEASRKCATTRIVQIVDTARGDSRELCVDFRIVAGVTGPQSEVVAREEHTGIPRCPREARQIERETDGVVLKACVVSFFDVARRVSRRFVDLRWIRQG